MKPSNPPSGRPSRPEFSRPLAADRNAPPSQAFAIVAEPAERAALACRFGLLSLDELRAEGSLETLAGGERAVLTARFVARLAQECVVTLEPVPATIEERFTLDYAVSDEVEVADELPVEIALDLEAADPPEPLTGGQVDVGEAVAEHLALALDPYPRAPEAKLADLGDPGDPEEGEDSPFKALAGLVKKGNS